MNNLKTYKKQKILVTGSTGFKGSWLCFWLNLLGAKFVVFVLKPEKGYIIFKKLKI
jgi:CDP-glucose 4,6-dehydratase